MNICRKRLSNEDLQEMASELFLVCYTAVRAQFHFRLLYHNSSPKFHNKNLPLSVALLKTMDVITTSTSHSTEQSENVLSATSKLLKYQYN